MSYIKKSVNEIPNVLSHSIITSNNRLSVRVLSEEESKRITGYGFILFTEQDNKIINFDFPYNQISSDMIKNIENDHFYQCMGSVLYNISAMLMKDSEATIYFGTKVENIILNYTQLTEGDSWIALNKILYQELCYHLINIKNNKR